MWPFTSKVGMPLLLTFYLLTVAQELPQTALGLLLARDLSLSPAETSSYYAAIFVPWTIKPVYGFISDNIPIMGWRRRPWLVLGCIGATGACVMQALLGHTQHTMLGYSILLAVFAASAECIADTCAVEIANRHATDITHAYQTRTRTHLQTQSQQPLISPVTIIPSQQPLLSPVTILPTHVDVEPAPETSFVDDKLTIASVITLVAAPPLLTHGIDHGIHHHTNDGYTPLVTDTTTTTTTTSSDDTLTKAINTMKASIQTECQVIRTCGSVTASALSILMLYLWDGTHGRRFIVGTAGIMYAISIIPAMYISETRVITSHFGLSANSHIELQLSQHSRYHFLIAKLIAVASLIRLYFIPAIFLFFYSSMPTSGDAYSTYLYDNFKQFMDWQQGLYNFVGFTGSLCGHLLYWRFLTHLNIQLVFIIATILASLASSLDVILALRYESYLWLEPSYFVPVSSFISSLFGAIALMPPIVLAALASHQHAIKMEGSMYALYASTQHLGTLLAAVWSSQLTSTLGITATNWSNLWKLIVICNSLALAPLFLVPLLQHVNYEGPHAKKWLWDRRHSGQIQEKVEENSDVPYNDMDGTRSSPQTAVTPPVL